MCIKIQKTILVNCLILLTISPGFGQSTPLVSSQIAYSKNQANLDSNQLILGSSNLYVGVNLGSSLLKSDVSSFNYFPGAKGIMGSVQIKADTRLGFNRSSGAGGFVNFSYGKFRGTKKSKLLFINDTVNYRGEWKNVSIGTIGEQFDFSLNVNIDLYKKIFKGENDRIRINGSIGAGLFYFKSYKFVKEEVFVRKPGEFEVTPLEITFKNRVISEEGYEGEIINDTRLDDEHLSLDWVSFPFVKDLKGQSIFDVPVVVTIPVGITLEYMTFCEGLYYTLDYRVLNTLSDKLDSYELSETRYDNISSLTVGIKFEF